MRSQPVCWLSLQPGPLTLSHFLRWTDWVLGLTSLVLQSLSDRRRFWLTVSVGMPLTLSRWTIVSLFLDCSIGNAQVRKNQVEKTLGSSVSFDGALCFSKYHDARCETHHPLSEVCCCLHYRSVNIQGRKVESEETPKLRRTRGRLFLTFNPPC